MTRGLHHPSNSSSLRKNPATQNHTRLRFGAFRSKDDTDTDPPLPPYASQTICFILWLLQPHRPQELQTIPFKCLREHSIAAAPVSRASISSEPCSDRKEPSQANHAQITIIVHHLHYLQTSFSSQIQAFHNKVQFDHVKERTLILLRSHDTWRFTVTTT